MNLDVLSGGLSAFGSYYHPLGNILGLPLAGGAEDDGLLTAVGVEGEFVFVDFDLRIAPVRLTAGGEEGGREGQCADCEMLDFHCFCI